MKLEDPPDFREDATGHLLCWGCGEFGQHGHGYRKEISFFDGAVEKFCGSPENCVKHVGCGASHTAVVTNDNEIFVWGNGNNGQLGNSDLATKLEPHKVSLYSGQTGNPSISGVACGGRHTVVWLENGQVFCFGNNVHVQLGFDLRGKENQAQPTLLKSLSHRPVAQVACGDKHTVFRFKDGGLACSGNNSHGQIGCGSREDATEPKFLKDFNEPIKTVETGARHSLAVTEAGDLYVWGFGKACGNRTEDVLLPTLVVTRRRNVIAAAGGSSHSMALTANGSVYTWGCGQEGQLGHGDKVRYLSTPRRVKDRHVISKCVQIACGETFSAAVTEKGLLYMWGKNSHTIMTGKPTSHKIYLPHGLNKNFRGGRIDRIFCGSWHAVAIIGRPALLIREEEDSGGSDEELLQEEQDLLDEKDEVESQASNSDVPPVSRMNRREDTKLEREKTTVSIADFYAPTPDLSKNVRSPSPEFYFTNNEEDNMPNSTRSAATLIVQLPLQPMTSYADAATSPMTLTTTSSNKSSSVTTLSRVPSPIQELFPRSLSTSFRKRTPRPEKKFKEFDPQKYEREKLRNTTPVVSEVVQVSKSSADSFTLPHETTGLSKKHVDFAEMEEIRLKGPKSPEKLSRLNKQRDMRTASPPKNRDHSPGKIRDLLSSRSKVRFIDSSCSYKSDSVLMESPLFKGSRQHASSEHSRRSWNSLPMDEERQYKHHVPKHLPRKYKSKMQSTDSNFGLQISRSKTVIAPVQADVVPESNDKISQLRRYAAIHNPQSSSGKGIGEKLRPLKTRHVSIPTGRPDSPVAEDIDQLYVGGPFNSQNKPSFSSGSTWKDKSDMERLPARKMAAAGIVRMYIADSDVVGSVETPFYSSLNDGRKQGDPLFDGDPFIVQPLLKTKFQPSGDSTTKIELPKIAIKPNSNGANDFRNRPVDNLCMGNEDLDLSITNTARFENTVDSRVS